MITLVIKELRWNWRSFRYPAFLIVVLFFALLDPLMMRYMNEIIAYFAEGLEMVMPDPTPGEVYVSYLSDVSQIGIFVLIFAVMGVVAREKETGITGWLLSKPVGRWEYLFSKIIVLYATIIIGIMGCSLIAYLYTASLFDNIPLGEAANATISLIFFTLFIATITLSLSTLLKSPLQAGGLTILIFFLTGILNFIIANSKFANYYPNTLLSQLRPLVDGTIGLTDVSGPILATIILSALMIIFTGIRFSRMEL
ncbi:MAG: ABC transporter permease subunit [Bacillota bacterium]|nr:ABC transporter permease subunit [Bacillota bacterium]